MRLLARALATLPNVWGSAIIAGEDEEVDARVEGHRHERQTSLERSMQYARLGNTGLIVSRLALGAMSFTSGKKALASIYKVGAGLADERWVLPNGESIAPLQIPRDRYSDAAHRRDRSDRGLRRHNP
jgi:hypothetical protein